MLLRTSDRRELCVLVIPPDMTPDQGDEALLAAATPGYAHSAASLLAKVTETADVEPGNDWNDDGGSWWGPDGHLRSGPTPEPPRAIPRLTGAGWQQDNHPHDEERPLRNLIGIIVVVWLVIGVFAAFQRGYFGTTAT